MRKPSRRRFLRMNGLAATVGVTGCSGITDNNTSRDSETQSLVWDFENQPADDGIPAQFENPLDSAQPLTWRSDQSRNGTEEVTTERSYSGSQSYHAAESAIENVMKIRPTTQPYDDFRTGEVSVALFRPDATNESTDAPRGKTSLHLHEESTEPCIAVKKEHDRLVVPTFGSSPVEISTAVGPNDWVYATISDIDVQNNTFSVSWSTDTDSDEMSDIEMVTPMNSGYTQTVIAIDDEGYADELTIA